MMYDKSGGGSELRKYLSCNLAYWHSYKQATKMIWKAFANTIWARMWHRMYPGSKFKVINPSPQEAAMHMVYMARAYPYFKSELEAAITEGSADEAGKAMLLNIQFLCEFAIPSVFPLPICCNVKISRGSGRWLQVLNHLMSIEAQCVSWIIVDSRMSPLFMNRQFVTIHCF